MKDFTNYIKYKQIKLYQIIQVEEIKIDADLEKNAKMENFILNCIRVLVQSDENP